MRLDSVEQVERLKSRQQVNSCTFPCLRWIWMHIRWSVDFRKSNSQRKPEFFYCVHSLQNLTRYLRILVGILQRILLSLSETSLMTAKWMLSGHLPNIKWLLRDVFTKSLPSGAAIPNISHWSFCFPVLVYIPVLWYHSVGSRFVGERLVLLSVQKILVLLLILIFFGSLEEWCPHRW